MSTAKLRRHRARTWGHSTLSVSNSISGRNDLIKAECSLKSSLIKAECPLKSSLIKVECPLKSSKATGIIRQISAIFDTKALGYASTLAAARVPDGRLDEAAAVVSQHPGVSHNYKREAEFNLWFTLAVPPGESLDGHLKRLADQARFEDYLALPTIRTFRIGVKLDVGGDRQADKTNPPAVKHHHRAEPVALTEEDRDYIRALQDDLPLEERPFEPACRVLGVGFDELHSWMQKMQGAGVLRRFAAILRHRQAGFSANGMVVWRVPDEHAA